MKSSGTATSHHLLDPVGSSDQIHKLGTKTRKSRMMHHPWTAAPFRCFLTLPPLSLPRRFPTHVHAHVPRAPHCLRRQGQCREMRARTVVRVPYPAAAASIDVTHDWECARSARRLSANTDTNGDSGRRIEEWVCTPHGAMKPLADHRYS